MADLAPAPGMFVDQVENGRAQLMNPDGSTFNVTAGPGMAEGQNLPVPATAQPLPDPNIVPVAAPVAAPVQPAAVDPVAASAAAIGKTEQQGAENVQIAQEKAKLDADQAAAKAQYDTEHAAKLEKFQADQLTARQAADAEVAAKRHEYNQKPFHSLWASRSTGQKAAIAFGLLLGGVSWNSNHQNRAIQVLSDAEAEDMQLQKEQHAALWQDLQLSLEGKKDLDSRQLHELGDWQARESAKWNGVASKLNAAIANNRGRADVSTATAAAQEATAKANQAHQNAIQAKATAMHMDAQTAYTKEETKTQDSVRAKNYADAANARAMAANGGVSKFDQQLILRIPTILQRDPDLKVLTSDKGPLKQLSDIQSLQQDLREASASGDAGRMAAAIAGAREQINRLNTGASPTKQTSELIDALQSEPSKIQANLSRLIGDPSNGKQFVDNLYHMLDNGREEKLHQIDDIRGRVDARHKNPKNPIRKSKAAADELDAIIDSNFQGVKNGGGTPRYPEGGSSPNQVTPQAAPAAAPAKPQPGAKARVGGNPVTYNGSLWIDDKTGKPVPGQ